jgi:hypothetical protein
MSSDAPVDEPDLPKRRLRFSLLTLLILFVVISLLLAWLVQPHRVVATALFDVRAEKPSLSGDAKPEQLDVAGFELLKRTQLALLKSEFLLQSAVRDPAIASLPTFYNKPDLIAWLQKNLEFEFPENGEILSIQLRGVKAQASDLVLIVDAVAEAYKKEVLGAETSRQLSQRDMLERSLQNLNAQIKRKYEDYLDIAKGMNRPESGSGDILQQLDVKRLQAMDEELMRLEGDQVKAEISGAEKDLKIANQRIEQLRKRKAELEKTVARRAERSVDLITRKEELDQLQRIANELNSKLEILDIHAQLPSRIRQIRPAVIAPDE